MIIFDYMERYNYEELLFCQDKDSGLKAIIAIHDTTLGPALGGTRMWPYSCEADAIEDVLRLARGMTYKNAAAGLNIGGGKAVIIGDPAKDKNEGLLRSFGRFIQGLNGRYITAEDVGTTVADMDIIHQETQFITGISPEFGASGNPAPFTALGVYKGMQAISSLVFKTESLAGRKITVQGMGSVAYFLCQYLHQEGAELVIADINTPKVEALALEFDAEVVSPEDIMSVECDIFAPCALGGIINDDTIPEFKCRIIAGAANNQLRSRRHGYALEKRGIVYAPDYVINAGGVINVADELLGYNKERATKRVKTIYDNILKVFDIAARDDIPPHEAADRLAEERIQAIGRTKTIFLRNPK